MRRIGVFGLAGIQNLGNECTLEAVVQQVSRRLPGADIFAISYEPEETSARHHVPSIPIRDSLSDWLRRSHSGSAASKFLGYCRRLFLRAPLEFASWLRAVARLRRTETLLMAGTGMLTDYGSSAFGLPWDVLKWVSAGRLAGCRVVFVGVGVGPLNGKLSRFFFRRALAAAHYVSYRDTYSKEVLDKLGFSTTGHEIVPDSVFGLVLADGQPKVGARRRRVGVGVISYFDEFKSGAENRDSVSEKRLVLLTEFISTLIEHGYDVRILCQDLQHDVAVKNALKAALTRANVQWAGRVFDDETGDTQAFVAQLNDCDVVVSPRFHTLLLGIMLAKPVISLTYEPKNDALLASVDLAKYGHELDDVDAERLLQSVLDIEARSAELVQHLGSLSAEFKARLERQYDQLFKP